MAGSVSTRRVGTGGTTREARSFVQSLKSAPVVAGIKATSDLALAAQCSVKVVFVLKGTIFELRKTVEEARERGLELFAHVDLIEGVAHDAAGMQFLAREIRVGGILTTRRQLAVAAKEAGLAVIQRVFALDAEALETGFATVRNASPHAVEILPAAIVPRIRRRLPAWLPPVIGGGLIERREEIDEILNAGAIAVSTSKRELWTYGA